MTISCFLGILLHYEDPALSDLYFVDPQWLCTMLACVVTVQEKNPFQKNGMYYAITLMNIINCYNFRFYGVFSSPVSPEK